MSEKVKVRIEMDQMFHWWPLNADQMAERYEMVGMPVPLRRSPTLEVDAELFNEYEAMRSKYYELQEKLEQLYRVQEGLEPWTSCPVPDYTKIEA